MKYLLLLLCVILSGCAKKPSMVVVIPNPPMDSIIWEDFPGDKGPWEIIEDVPILKESPRPPLNNVFFALNVDTLKPGQIRLLKELQAYLVREGKTARLMGFADTVGALGYNRALSLRRARNVAVWLPNASVDALGETDVWGVESLNRRVHIILKDK